jgi:hypothetical protein
LPLPPEENFFVNVAPSTARRPAHFALESLTRLKVNPRPTALY